MSLMCTACQGTGFLHSDLLPSWVRRALRRVEFRPFHEWLKRDPTRVPRVPLCTCCGDGQRWYGTPGQHYGEQDPPGPHGPYASHGGRCECHQEEA